MWSNFLSGNDLRSTLFAGAKTVVASTRSANVLDQALILKRGEVPLGGLCRATESFGHHRRFELNPILQLLENPGPPAASGVISDIEDITDIVIRLINRNTFDLCQDVLHGRNRRTGSPDLPYSGGLFQCAYCGQSITGERIRRKLKDGGVREHTYYRCANNSPGDEHPRVRWKADDLEKAVVDDLDQMRLATPELAAWFRTELRAAVTDLTAYRRQQSKTLGKRKTELATMQDRLLNAYLAGTVEEVVYKAKSNELKAEAARADETLAQMGDVDPARAETALALFDWTQNAAEIWRGSNNRVRREILDAVCLNRTLGDVNLDATKRKPFDVFAKGFDFNDSRSFDRLLGRYTLATARSSHLANVRKLEVRASR